MQTLILEIATLVLILGVLYEYREIRQLRAVNALLKGMAKEIRDTVRDGLNPPSQPVKAARCVWKLDEDKYVTSCGPKKYVFMSPNGMTYCPYCGARIEIAS